MAESFEEEEESPPAATCSEGAPLWVVSYGDMMTLLLCFFVLYFNMDVSNGLKDIADENSVMAELQTKNVTDSTSEKKDPNTSAIINQIVSQLEKSLDQEVNQTYNGLIPIMEKVSEQNGAKLVKIGEKIEISLPSTHFFSRGKAELISDKKAIFEDIFQVLKKQEERINIEIEGHTDNIPIQGWLSRYFPSNWELSSARASTIIRLFQEKGLKPKSYSALGIADTQPIAPNDSEANRQLNRRVVIRINYHKGVANETPPKN